MAATEQSMTSGGTAEEQAIPADDNEVYPAGQPMGRADVGTVLKMQEETITSQ